MVQIIHIIMAILAIGVALLSILLLFPLPRPTTPAWWALKAIPTVLALFMFIAGLLFLASGLFSQSPVQATAGLYAAVMYGVHIFKITRSPDPRTGFEHAFGDQWEASIPPGHAKHLLKTRLGIGFPDAIHSGFVRNIPYYTIPGSNRELLCDIWQPRPEVKRSRLAFIYVHGSAWYVWDKDAGTRPFFRHLASLGHVIMDVAYRLYPETDMMGMVFDVKHAIAWMKDHADTYGIDATRIVVGGGSAGGHLSLLSAYTNGNSVFTPDDLMVKDTRVRGVISLYGPADLKDLYFHTGQHVTTRRFSGGKKTAPAELPAWVKKKLGENYHRLGLHKNPEAGLLAPMFGGNPSEKPELYRLFSPVSHVHSHCPPTLLVQGEHDIITSTTSTKLLFKKLKEARVPAVMHLLPQVDHAFDLLLPAISPSAHNACYDVDRFLALMAADIPARVRQNTKGVEVVHR